MGYPRVLATKLQSKVFVIFPNFTEAIRMGYPRVLKVR
jgi:hypothetical protein